MQTVNPPLIEAEATPEAATAPIPLYHLGIMPSSLPLIALIARIKRRRKGGKRHAALRLRDQLQCLANRRWARRAKGQRRPSANQAVAIIDTIREALDHVQGRHKVRCLSLGEILAVAREAAESGISSCDGGRVTASSYGHPWTTTEALARRLPTGEIEVTIDRVASSRFVAQARHLISLRTSELLDGDVVAVDCGDFWRHYRADGAQSCVSVPMPSDLAKFGRREHGTDLAACAAEIARKRAVSAERQSHQRAIAKEERRAKLFARLSHAGLVDFRLMRQVGACEAGIAAWAAGHGKTLQDRVSLAEIARDQPMWALRAARAIIAIQAQSPQKQVVCPGKEELQAAQQIVGSTLPPNGGEEPA